jgi:hypothetical protein
MNTKYVAVVILATWHSPLDSSVHIPTGIGGVEGYVAQLCRAVYTGDARALHIADCAAQSHPYVSHVYSHDRHRPFYAETSTELHHLYELMQAQGRVDANVDQHQMDVDVERRRNDLKSAQRELAASLLRKQANAKMADDDHESKRVQHMDGIAQHDLRYAERERQPGAQHRHARIQEGSEARLQRRRTGSPRKTVDQANRARNSAQEARATWE